ncbi:MULTISPECIES: PucR family transcriptional regulator [Fictibacillus]|uniref:PucR family transcriptional regulator n=1 Tax=Fictibacillus enclensis TaxID=1017270 RepID=A0A0V8J4E8_9BACL|nr:MULTISPECIES: helix-turn-helix domain-containing protein [Fictibacillus]KSU81764.1 PucR family transcriptional regulator [Fictibacillus enclensis]RXZ01191.1 PucR family transcriptional regulator [Fictibacillus sp. S7]SCC25763.1 DNA-binding transcriptional regulator, PucR family [Fictibacillus enclensis]
MNSFSHPQDPFKGTFGSLENLADTISEVLHCPVTIEDANHRLLAYSTHEDSTDPARIATIIGRRVPEKVINSLWRDGVIPRLQSSDEPLRVSSISKVGLGDRVAVSIRKNEEVLGYIWALEVDRHLAEEDLKLLKKAAQSAKNQLLQHYTGSRRKQESLQEFFWKLLTGHMNSEEAILDSLRDLGIMPCSPVSVLIFQFPQEIDAAFGKNVSYITSVNQSVKAQLTAADENQMIMLVTSSRKEDLRDILQEFIRSFTQQMAERFGVKGITAGFGGVYNAYQLTEKSFKEAQQVIKIKDRFSEGVEDLFGYESLGIYQFLDVIHEQQQASRYHNPSLAKLQEYDRLHKTDLYQTLDTYLSAGSNAHQTAAVLHIHLNTLTYRLKRIAEVGQIDYKNTNQKTMLYLDLQIQRLFS